MHTSTDDSEELGTSDLSPLEPHGSPSGAVSIAGQMRSLLADAGILLHKQRSYVANALKTTYPTARRLLLGMTPWTDAEISTVLKSIDLTWTGLNVFSPDKPASPTGEQALIKRLGLITIDGIEMCCDVYLTPDPQPMPPAADALCIEDDSNAMAYVIRSSPTSRSNRSTFRQIKSVHIQPKYRGTGPLVAILDDSKDVVDTLKEALDIIGFRTEGFTSASELVERSRVEPPISAYLMDWSLQGGDTISNYIPKLREASPHAAMLLMSGHFDTKDVDAEAMRMSEQYNLGMLPKPAPIGAITRTLLMSLRPKD